MSKEAVVSIITPCYNGEKCVHRFLDSILAQTYSFIELILINDGSTDNTEKIVLSYKYRFESKGIKFVYIFQENKGVGGAINAGLKKVTGKYLCWPDYDDYLEPESIELRLKILEKFPEFAIVASDAYIRSIENPDLSIRLASAGFKNSDDPDQFVHLLNGRSYICSGCYMVRTKVFFETHPSGEIYPAKKGQNYQMLLPVYYLHKRYFLNKPLYNYIRYSASLSQNGAISFREEIYEYIKEKDIFIKTLSAMNMTEKDRTYYINIVDIRFSAGIFRFACDHGDHEMLNQEYANLKKLNQLSSKLRLQFILAKCKLLFIPFFSKHHVLIS
jgi:glycosyltransferase involved in cell wall biosynthesis